MTIDGFRAQFSGVVLGRETEGYDVARAPWNGDIDRRPAVITQCGTAEEVAASIRFGREKGFEVAVRGGGHSFAGHGVCEGGLMLDLSPMRNVAVDAAAR